MWASLRRASRVSWWARPRCWCPRRASAPTLRPGARLWPASWPPSAASTRSVSHWGQEQSVTVISVQIPYLPLQHCLHSEVCLSSESEKKYCTFWKVDGVIKTAPSRRLVSAKGVLGSEGKLRIASEIADYVGTLWPGDKEYTQFNADKGKIYVRSDKLSATLHSFFYNSKYTWLQANSWSWINGRTE